MLRVRLHGRNRLMQDGKTPTDRCFHDPTGDVATGSTFDVLIQRAEKPLRCLTSYTSFCAIPLKKVVQISTFHIKEIELQRIPIEHRKLVVGLFMNRLENKEVFRSKSSDAVRNK